MTDLVAFLTARLDEDEQVARGADTSPEMVTGIPRSYADAPVAIHISRWTPARVLAEVDAKRRIMDKVLATGHAHNEEDHWYSCAALTGRDGEFLCLDDSRAGKPCDCGRERTIGQWLALLALPYSFHPDYRPEWAPEA